MGVSPTGPKWCPLVAGEPLKRVYSCRTSLRASSWRRWWDTMSSSSCPCLYHTSTMMCYLARGPRQGSPDQNLQNHEPKQLLFLYILIASGISLYWKEAGQYKCMSNELVFLNELLDQTMTHYSKTNQESSDNALLVRVFLKLCLFRVNQRLNSGHAWSHWTSAKQLERHEVAVS